MQYNAYSALLFMPIALEGIFQNGLTLICESSSCMMRITKEVLAF